MGIYNFYSQFKVNHFQGPITKSFAVRFTPKSIGGFISISGGIREFYVFNKIRKTNISLGLNLDLKVMSFYAAYDKSEYFLENNKLYFSINLKV